MRKGVWRDAKEIDVPDGWGVCQSVVTIPRVGATCTTLGTVLTLGEVLATDSVADVNDAGSTMSLVYFGPRATVSTMVPTVSVTTQAIGSSAFKVTSMNDDAISEGIFLEGRSFQVANGRGDTLRNIVYSVQFLDHFLRY